MLNNYSAMSLQYKLGIYIKWNELQIMFIIINLANKILCALFVM